MYQCKLSDPPPEHWITYGYVAYKCDKQCKCKRVPAWYIFRRGCRVLFRAAERLGTVDYATEGTVYVLLDGDKKTTGFSPRNLRPVRPEEDWQLKLEF